MNFLDRFSKTKAQILSCIKIRPVGAELFHPDGLTEMAKLIVAFRTFGNVAKKVSSTPNETSRLRLSAATGLPIFSRMPAWRPQGKMPVIIDV